MIIVIQNTTRTFYEENGNQLGVSFENDKKIQHVKLF